MEFCLDDCSIMSLWFFKWVVKFYVIKVIKVEISNLMDFFFLD